MKNQRKDNRNILWKWNDNHTKLINLSWEIVCTYPQKLFISGESLNVRVIARGYYNSDEVLKQKLYR